MATAHKEPFHTFKFETCEKKFMDKDEFNIHTASVHEEKKPIATTD